MTSNSTDTVLFAEKVIALLDQGRQTATYKYAVLLGLMDLCLELTDRFGEPPSSITAGQLAEKIIELYWSHSAPFDPDQELVLRQNTGKRARVLTLIDAFRSANEADPSVTLHAGRLRNPDGYRALRAQVEWTLVKMPLPKLQRVGTTQDRFVYEVSWGDDVTEGQWKHPDFDNRIHLQPGAALALVRLAGLLRPLIQEKWVAMVGRLNELDVSRVHGFLFGVERSSLAAVRAPLRELQGDRCFYCDGALRDSVEVDHFLPWARHADNGIENLVAAHGRCNGAKKDFLAASAHLERWASRAEHRQGDLEHIAATVRWPRDRVRTLGAVRGVYLRLPVGVALWRAKQDFETSSTENLRAALRVA